jgi:MFS family permease
MLQLGEGIGQVFAPLLAGVLIGAIGLQGVLIADIITFIFAIVTLLAVRFPPITAAKKIRKTSTPRWAAELREALNFLWARPGLIGLLLVFALVNFFVGMAEAVLTPMVLSFSSAEKLGLILTVGGAGMLIGSLLATAYGDRWRKIYTVFGAYAFIGVAVTLAGLRPSVGLVALAVFLAFLALPAVMSASQAILQAKVDPDLQGRVFGLRILVNTGAFAVAYLLGGVLADNLFEPLMAGDSLVANLFGPWIGTGPGRGMALMFVSMGILSIATALSAFAYPRIRHVESELPDSV